MNIYKLGIGAFVLGACLGVGSISTAMSAKPSTVRADLQALESATPIVAATEIPDVGTDYQREAAAATALDLINRDSMIGSATPVQLADPAWVSGTDAKKVRLTAIEEIWQDVPAQTRFNDLQAGIESVQDQTDFVPMSHNEFRLKTWQGISANSQRIHAVAFGNYIETSGGVSRMMPDEYLEINVSRDAHNLWRILEIKHHMVSGY